VMDSCPSFSTMRWMPSSCDGESSTIRIFAMDVPSVPRHRF
jgi:hypothetical protein